MALDISFKASLHLSATRLQCLFFSFTGVFLNARTSRTVSPVSDSFRRFNLGDSIKKRICVTVHECRFERLQTARGRKRERDSKDGKTLLNEMGAHNYSGLLMGKPITKETRPSGRRSPEEADCFTQTCGQTLYFPFQTCQEHLDPSSSHYVEANADGSVLGPPRHHRPAFTVEGRRRPHREGVSVGWWGALGASLAGNSLHASKDVFSCLL